VGLLGVRYITGYPHASYHAGYPSRYVIGHSHILVSSLDLHWGKLNS